MIEHPEDRNLKSIDFAEVIADSGSALGRPQQLFERLMYQRHKPLLDPNQKDNFNWKMELSPNIFLRVSQMGQEYDCTRTYYEFDPSYGQTQFPRHLEIDLKSDVTSKTNEFVLTRIQEWDHRHFESTAIEFSHYPSVSNYNYINMNRTYGALALTYYGHDGNLINVDHKTDLDRMVTFKESEIKDLIEKQESINQVGNNLYFFRQKKNSLTIEVITDNEITDIIQVPLLLDFPALRHTLVSPELLNNKGDTTGKFDYTWRSADVKFLAGIRWENLKAERNEVFSYNP